VHAPEGSPSCDQLEEHQMRTITKDS